MWNEFRLYKENDAIENYKSCCLEQKKNIYVNTPV